MAAARQRLRRSLEAVVGAVAAAAVVVVVVVVIAAAAIVATVRPVVMVSTAFLVAVDVSTAVLVAVEVVEAVQLSGPRRSAPSPVHPRLFGKMLWLF